MWPLRAAMFVLFFCGCWCQHCNLTQPYFKSRNFFSVLHWDPVDLPGQAALYSVQYNPYGRPCQPVSWCQNISTPVCDLTDVTSEVLTNVAITYRVIILIGNQCVGEVKFSPFHETILGAPQLTITSNLTYLNVTAAPQSIPWNRSIEHNTFWGDRRGVTRTPVEYTVHLTHPTDRAKDYVNKSRSVLIWLSQTDVQYCGEVFYSLTHPGWLGDSENTTFCHTVSAPKTLLQILIWPGVLAVLLVISVSIMLCRLSMKRKRPLPKSLMLPENRSPQLCSAPKDNISKVDFWFGIFGITLEPQTPPFTPQKSEIMAKETTYASQEPCRCQQDVPIQNSGESSVNYSLCLPVQIPSEPFNTELSSDSSSPEPNSTAVIHSDAESATLVLPVRPDGNGALQFHRLFFQCDTDLNSPEEAQDSAGEQMPLLTELVIQKDSTYFPMHVSKIVTSSYRQNWVPGLPLEGQEDQRTYIMRTEKSEEDFREPQESRFGVVVLDR